MRRLALILFLFAFAFSAHAQKDSELLLNADFSALQLHESAPEGANAAELAMYGINRQLTGRDFYDPPNYMFFRQAVKTLGFIPAVFATADRILRDSKLGTATVKLDPSDPFIHEGPEAYLPEKRRERK